MWVLFLASGCEKEAQEICSGCRIWAWLFLLFPTGRRFDAGTEIVPARDIHITKHDLCFSFSDYPLAPYEYKPLLNSTLFRVMGHNRSLPPKWIWSLPLFLCCRISSLRFARSLFTSKIILSHLTQPPISRPRLQYGRIFEILHWTVNFLPIHSLPLVHWQIFWKWYCSRIIEHQYDMSIAHTILTSCSATPHSPSIKAAGCWEALQLHHCHVRFSPESLLLL